MQDAATGQAARLIAGGAATVAGAVLADSSIEHYRGSFENRTMVLPLVTATLSILTNGAVVAGGRPAVPKLLASWRLTAPIHVAAIGVGAVGFGFHSYNILKQPGGVTWQAIFYKAPIGAPAAMVLAGVLGSAAMTLQAGGRSLGPVPLLSGRALAGTAALGIAGSAAEAALLHFRGAYHNPAMYLAVTIPPLTALSLAGAAITGRGHPITVAALGLTAALGLIGSAFHAYGVSRNMGGWKNWRQNLVVGPPIPAPPAFTGLAIAGLGALLLMGRGRRD
ncbi:hypothetical protein ABVV53_13040 [Novosphingobium sp. RD2P27]|uniref:Uncharacterized protein n=1 Tax=Novosphingobium kalidii TaxID=3230299 RepID=A0ABV2D3T7_9SPHN